MMLAMRSVKGEKPPASTHKVAASRVQPDRSLFAPSDENYRKLSWKEGRTDWRPASDGGWPSRRHGLVVQLQGDWLRQLNAVIAAAS